MIDSKKVLQNKAGSYCNSGSISMIYQRNQATYCLLISLHYNGGGGACEGS